MNQPITLSAAPAPLPRSSPAGRGPVAAAPIVTRPKAAISGHGQRARPPAPAPEAPRSRAAACGYDAEACSQDRPEAAISGHLPAPHAGIGSRG